MTLNAICFVSCLGGLSSGWVVEWTWSRSQAHQSRLPAGPADGRCLQQPGNVRTNHATLQCDNHLSRRTIRVVDVLAWNTIAAGTKLALIMDVDTKRLSITTQPMAALGA
jgi:hypothetical protein